MNLLQPSVREDGAQRGHIRPVEALRLTPEGDIKPVQLNEALRLAWDGEIILIKQALQNLGTYRSLYDDSIEAIKDVSSEEVANQVSEAGFEKIHEILSPRQILSANQRMHEIIAPKVINITRNFVEGMMAYKKPYYICKLPVIRTFIPQDTLADSKEIFSWRLGTLLIHGPHRDSWHTHAYDGLNLWMAISHVLPGNGMTLYPGMWNKPVEYEGISISRHQAVGKPVNLNMEPGDLLLFHGEHLHASELNVTDQTRYVISTRFVFGPPRYGEGSNWIPYAYTPLLGSPMKFGAAWRSYCSLAFLRSSYCSVLSRVMKKLWA